MIYGLKGFNPYWQIFGAGDGQISGKLNQTTYQIWMSFSEIGLAHVLKIEISKKMDKFSMICQ